MSFSTGVKDELLTEQVLSECCNHAQAYGLLLFGKAFNARTMAFTSEYAPAAQQYADALMDFCGVGVTVHHGANRINTVLVRAAADRLKVLNTFGHSQGEISLRINRANLNADCCFGAFVKGAFLSCGTVTSPDKNYHLEFVVNHSKLSADLQTLLNEVGFSPKRVMRNSYHVLYFKDSESIEDILTLMGATNASLEIMSAKMEKDLRNHANRRTNFDIANIGRIVQAGESQRLAVEKIARTTGLDSLPESLQKIAKIRLDNPDATLEQIRELLDEPISRSGVNHRLRKLIDIADKTET